VTIIENFPMQCLRNSYLYVQMIPLVIKNTFSKASLNTCFIGVSCTLNRVPHKQNC